MVIGTLLTIALCGQSAAFVPIPIDDIAAPEVVEQQHDQKPDRPPTPERTGFKALFGNLAGDYTHLWHRDNFYVAAAGGGLAMALHPLDQDFNVRLRSHYRVVNDVFAPAKYYGNTLEQVALSVGTFAVGRAIGSDKTAHFGMDLLRAQIVAESIVQPIKFAVQRERPNGSNNYSFPSGHAAVTFADATVIERHLGWKFSAVGYAVATYVAASRMHDNVHYLSDVVFGAAIGTIAGRTVTQHGRSYWTFIPVNVPGGGVALIVSRNAS